MMGSGRTIDQTPVTASGTYPGVVSESLDINAVVRLLLRRKALIAGTTLLVTLLAAVVTLLVTPRYSATAYVLIEPGQTQIVEAIEAVVAGSSADTAAVESQLRVLQSRALADRVVNALRLDRDPEFNGSLAPKSLLDQWLDPARRAIAAAAFTLRRWIAGAEDQPKSEDAVRALRSHVIDAVLSRLDARIEGGSRVIGVTFTSRSPATAAKVANAVVDQYIAMQLEGKYAATRDTSQWLNDRVQELRRRVELAEAAAEKYRAENGLISRGDVSITTEEALGVGEQLALARSKRAEAEARLREIDRATADGAGAGTVSEVLGSGLIQALRQQEAAVERRVSELSQSLGRSHPDLRSARAELGQIRAKIEAETGKIIQKLQNEVDAAVAREAVLSGSLESLKGQAGQQNQIEVKLRALEREATASRTLLETLLARAEETASQESYQRVDAQIVSRADSPNAPSYPKTLLMIGAGFVVALMCALLLAFLLESTDSGFRSEEQIEQTLGFASLGLVPSLKRAWGGSQRPSSAYVANNPASAYVESIRGLWTSLRLSNGDHVPRVVLIASALPNEGKTTLAISFASVLSSQGLRVLVIDTDLRKPSVHRVLGMTARPGLLDHLKNHLPLTSIIQHEPSTGIDVIAAGRSKSNRAGLLSTDRMKELLAQLRSTYDIIILDSAPMLAVAEARILVRIADKTVFLIRWADTRRNTAMRGLQHVVDAGSNLVGVMLTRVDLRRCARHRYGEFGYYYPRIESYYGA
jgi:capsular exopolysaccharide synthesis family protein